jgi:hypothetical protein
MGASFYVVPETVRRVRLAEASYSPPQQELDRTHDLIMDPAIYIPFTVVGGRRVEWCIHPTDEDVDQLRTVVQTPGGAHGEAMHTSIALSNVQDTYISPEEALLGEIQLRGHTTIIALHNTCKFAQAYRQVLREMREPGLITEDTAERWMHLHKIGKASERSRLISEVREGADLQLEQLPEADEEMSAVIETMAEVADTHSHYSTRTNVRGENKALAFATNHTIHFGLNRQAVHRGENSLEVQFYHNSLGATLLETRIAPYEDVYNHPDKLRALKSTSIILGSAATKTLLSFPAPIGLAARQHSLYEVNQGDYGPVVKKVEEER